MKKLIALLGFAFLTTGLSFAYLEEGKTSNIDVLKGQGFSESALKIVDTVNQQLQGQENYASYYVPKKGKHKLGRAYTRIKLYFDPIQDDGVFGEHQINFGNIWRSMEEETSYSTKLEPRQNIENL